MLNKTERLWKKSDFVNKLNKGKNDISSCLFNDAILNLSTRFVLEK